MKVTVKVREGVSIVALEGKLVSDVGDVQLRAAVDQLLGQRTRSILLDLTKVDSIDSAGVGELVASLRTCQRFQADLKVLRPGDRALHVLHLSQILPLFEVYDGEAEAMAAFKESRLQRMKAEGE